MVTRNDITGDKIQSKENNKAYQDNYDKIFSNKKKETHKILRQETKWEGPPINFDEDRIDTIGQNGNNGEHYE